jgi:hypothetical protein
LGRERRPVPEVEDLSCAVCGQPWQPGVPLVFEAAARGVLVLHSDCNRREKPRDPAIASLLKPLAAVMVRVAEIRDGDPGPVLDLLRSAHARANDAEAILAGSDREGSAAREWLHALRGAFHGLLSWATIFTTRPDAATRLRAAGKMQAFHADVVRLVTAPPSPGRG